MIADTTEYELAQAEIRELEERLARLQQEHPASKGLTKAGLHKLIARLHEELAVFEGTAETKELESP